MGDTCHFAHGEQEIRDPNAVSIWPMLRHNCTADSRAHEVSCDEKDAHQQQTPEWKHGGQLPAKEHARWLPARRHALQRQRTRQFLRSAVLPESERNVAEYVWGLWQRRQPDDVPAKLQHPGHAVLGQLSKSSQQLQDGQVQVLRGRTQLSLRHKMLICPRKPRAPGQEPAAVRAKRRQAKDGHGSEHEQLAATANDDPSLHVPKSNAVHFVPRF